MAGLAGLAGCAWSICGEVLGERWERDRAWLYSGSTGECWSAGTAARCVCCLPDAGWGIASPAETDSDEEGGTCTVWLLVVAAAAAAAAGRDGVGSGRWDRGLGAVELGEYER